MRTHVAPQLLEGCTCVSNLANGYQNLDMVRGDYAQTMVEHPPIEQPVITFDASTGQRMLSVNEAYSVRICQLQRDESAALVRPIASSSLHRCCCYCCCFY